jgi:hypothetical protein
LVGGLRTLSSFNNDLIYDLDNWDFPDFAIFAIFAIPRFHVFKRMFQECSL